MLEYIPGILMAYGAFLMGIVSPGPNIMAVIGTSMATGRGAGRSLALGVATGSFLWGCLTLLGLTALLTLYASVLTAIKIFGALYLLWLAFKAFRSSIAPGQIASSEVEGASPRALFGRGLLIQMTNPKAALTWVAIMSLALSHEAPWWVGAFVVGGAGLLSAVIHTSYALAFSTGPMVQAYLRARRGIDAVLGTFFCFASYKLLTTRI